VPTAVTSAALPALPGGVRHPRPGRDGPIVGWLQLTLAGDSVDLVLGLLTPATVPHLTLENACGLLDNPSAPRSERRSGGQSRRLATNTGIWRSVLVWYSAYGG
jgi:hypothetical protein